MNKSWLASFHLSAFAPPSKDSCRTSLLAIEQIGDDESQSPEMMLPSNSIASTLLSLDFPHTTKYSPITIRHPPSKLEQKNAKHYDTKSLRHRKTM